MRILTINYEYPPVGGGGGVAHKVLVDEWKKDHDVTLITTHVKGQLYREEDGRLHIYRAPCGRRSLAAAEFYALLAFFLSPVFWLLWLKASRRHFDVINAQFAIPSGVIGCIAKWLFHLPLIVSIHGGDIYDPSKKTSPHKYWFSRAVVSWVLRSADAIIAQSENTAENARTYYSFDTPIQIIPLPLEKHDAVDEFVLSPLIPRYTFIAVGRLVARKGFDILIRAFSRVRSQHPDVTLCIIGNGPMEAALRQLIRDEDSESSISIRVDVDNALKNALLKKASCFVLSSHHEGYGIVVQEAMQAGIPIVATNHGGQTDFLKHQKNALLCDPGNVDALAEAMQEMIDRPDLGQAYILNYPATLDTFDPSRIADSTIKVFSTYL